MKLSPTLQAALTRINTALINGREDELVKCLNETDLDVLLSQDTLAKLRARGKVPLCNFIATLAVANEVEPKRAQVWLDAYHSIATGSTEAALLRLPPNNVWRQAVEAQAHKAALSRDALKNTKGSPQEWQDAFELCMDMRDWESALHLLETLAVKRVETRRWFELARALSQRQELLVDSSGIGLVDIDYDRLARLYQLCANAARNAKAASVVQSLELLRASCLETGGHHGLAIDILRPLDKGPLAEKVKIAIARNLCRSGDLAQSILQLDTAIHAHKINGRTLEDLESSDMAIEGPRKKKAGFNVNRAAHTLSDLARVVERSGEKLFLVSGTLLGYEREGKIMDHDKDIDVGVIGWEKQYDICMALQESGLFTVDTKFLKGAGTHYIPLAHNYTGMYVDLFVYERQGEKLVTGVDFFFGYRQTFAFTPFELKPVKFLGVDMYVPSDVDLNLRENFGDWRTPDASYISHLESPSTTNKGALPFMLTARINALCALIEHKPRKVRKVIAMMRQYASYPMAMDEGLLSLLERHCVLLEERSAPAQTAMQASIQPHLEEAHA